MKPRNGKGELGGVAFTTQAELDAARLIYENDRRYPDSWVGAAMLANARIDDGGIHGCHDIHRLAAMGEAVQATLTDPGQKAEVTAFLEELAVYVDPPETVA